MRLTSQDRNIIKSTILSFCHDAKIILFGSRAADDKRGGDIDLLIRTCMPISMKQKIKILAQLELNGIKRKVDLLILSPDTQKQLIVNQALKDGVPL